MALAAALILITAAAAGGGAWARAAVRTPSAGTSSGAAGTRLAQLEQLHLAQATTASSRRAQPAPDQPLPVTAAAPQAQDRPAGATPAPNEWMVQLDYTAPGNSPWTLSTFQYLASLGITGIELNLRWNSIEPTPDQFSLSTVESYTQYAAQAHLVLIPIFWESVWGGNNPSWLPAASEQTNTGALDQQPAMWSSNAYDAYATYVTTVLKAVTDQAGYGGAYIDYGWLDAMWGPPPSGGGMAGYAAVDVAAFHNWLAQRYHTIAVLNKALGTDYPSFSAVPAFLPGDPHFSVYQQFRIASYQIIMSQLLTQVRQVTDKPLYLYFGGDMDNGGVLGNIPDQVFSLASEFKAVVTLDDADNSALADLFGYLSQAYGVPLLNEWTPIPGNAQEVAFWQSHYTLEGANRLGEDYFLYSGGTASGTFAQYLSLKSTVQQVTGHMPDYRVGIMVGYNQLYQGLQQEGIPGGDASLATYLDTTRPAAQVFTDQAVLQGRIALSSFRTIIDWSDDLQTPGLDPALTRQLRSFQDQGGSVVEAPVVDGTPTPPAGSVPAAFTVSPQSTQIETWAAVDGTKVWVTIANGEEDLPIDDTLSGGGRTTLGNETAYTGTVTAQRVLGLRASQTINVNVASATLLEQPFNRF